MIYIKCKKGNHNSFVNNHHLNLHKSLATSENHLNGFKRNIDKSKFINHLINRIKIFALKYSSKCEIDQK